MFLVVGFIQYETIKFRYSLNKGESNEKHC